MSTQAITRLSRVQGTLKRVRAELKESGRIGVHALLAASGGAIGGMIDAKWPIIPNTTLTTNAVVGVGLVVGALANIFEEYSDEVASTGAGILAYELGKASQKYFDPSLF
jgi:hypothetical protein